MLRNSLVRSRTWSTSLMGPAMRPSSGARLFASQCPNASATSSWRTASVLGASLLGAAGLYHYSSPTVHYDTDGALDPDQFIDFEIEKVEELSHDTKRFTFKLPENQTLGMKVASLLVVKTPPKEGEDKPVIKPYTPVSKDTPGSFTLVIKKYSDGAATPYIHTLKKGDTLPMKGPWMKFEYKPNMKREIGMLAGGTGITPMHQVLSEITSNQEDETRVTLIYVNKTEEDILLREELAAIEKDHPNVNIVYKVSRERPEEEEDGFIRIASLPNPQDSRYGRITKRDIQRHLPGPGEDTMILVCGPPGFYNTYSGAKGKGGKQGELDGYLKDLGYTEEQVFKF